MRVVSGMWRGRRLLSPEGDAVRPTTDRVKEALFSILGPRVRDAHVLDLCCGTGGLGIEALSRGAAHVKFVDADRRSLLLAGRNLNTCGAEAERYELVPGDALAYLQGVLPRLRAGSAPWIVLADPPYGAPLAGAIVQDLRADEPAEAFVAAVVEHGDARLFAEEAGPPWRLRNRRYGKTILTVLERG